MQIKIWLLGNSQIKIITLEWCFFGNVAHRKYNPLTDVIFQRHQIHPAYIIYFETRICKFNQTDIGILKLVCRLFKGISVGCITSDKIWKVVIFNAVYTIYKDLCILDKRV